MEKFEKKKTEGYVEMKIEENFGEKLAEKIEHIDTCKKTRDSKEERIFKTTTNIPNIKLSIYDGKAELNVFSILDSRKR